MKRISIYFPLLFSLLFLLPACASQSAPTTSPVEATPLPSETKAPAQLPIKEPWQAEWERILEAAGKEGRVVIYSGAGAQVRTLVIGRFKNKYGIAAEWVAAREYGEKVLTERRAGLRLVDLAIGGLTTMVTQLKPAGVLEPLEPMLLLPEVTQPQAWYEEKLPWADKEHRILSFSAYPSPPLAINSEQVRGEEIASYRDLLNPRWKGKILLNDPTVGGPGARWFGVVGTRIMGMDFMRELARQEPVILRDQRLQVEWLARGKYPIAIAPDSPVIAEFFKAGAPLKEWTPKEGAYLTSGYGNVAFIGGAPHLNAAKLFLNWLLSKEGQTVWSQGVLRQSTRVDVPTDFLDPLSIRQPGVKYYVSDDEEFLLQQPERMKLAKELFGIK